MRTAVLTAFAATALLAGMASASAQAVNGSRAARIMHERHEGMEQIGKSTRTIKRALDASSPDVAEIRRASATISALAARSQNWFPRGTGPNVGRTGAKLEIWQNPADYAAKDRDFIIAARRLNSAAAAGNVAAIRASFGRLGNSCKACHDKYRADMHH